MIHKLVSIIIPAYNVASYIGETLESVIRQTYSSIEIIVVNDGSTDSTHQVIENYAKRDPRIKIIFQENKGLSCARNTGIRGAKGDYLCIFDADDIMMPRKIEKQVEYLELNQQCEVTYSDVYQFHDSTRKVFLWAPPSNNRDLYKSLLIHGNFINPNVVFFRSSVFKQHGYFDEDLRSSEDWDFWLRLSYCGVRFCHQSEILTIYRIRNSGLSGNRVRMCFTATQVLKKQYQLDQSQESLIILHTAMRSWNISLLIAYLRDQDWIKAKTLFHHGGLFRIIYYSYRCIPRFICNTIFTIVFNMRFRRRHRPISNITVDQLLAINK